MKDFALLFAAIFIGGVTWDLLKWAISGRPPWECAHAACRQPREGGKEKL